MVLVEKRSAIRASFTTIRRCAPGARSPGGRTDVAGTGAWVHLRRGASVSLPNGPCSTRQRYWCPGVSPLSGLQHRRQVRYVRVVLTRWKGNMEKPLTHEQIRDAARYMRRVLEEISPTDDAPRDRKVRWCLQGAVSALELAAGQRQ
jgi:hypothetical protein